MTKFLLSPLIIVGTAALLSCSTHRDVVPLSEFQSTVDSIAKANGVKIFVAPNQYNAYGVSRQLFEDKKQTVAKYCIDTATVYTIKMESYDAMSIPHRNGPDTLEAAIARYWHKEELRKHRKNRISWREFKEAVRKINPDVVLVPKKEWAKSKMLRSELSASLSGIKPFKPATYILERDSSGWYRTVKKVTDSVELAKIKARHYRWNSVANGMLGAAHTDEPYVGLMFGAEGYRLSDTERLWLKVDVGHCHPFPSAKPTCKVYDYGTYVKVKEPDGQEETIYIKVRDPHFRLLQNPPFKYTFTANFEYAGRWYYVYLCDDPLKCVCKPIDTRQKDFPEL